MTCSNDDAHLASRIQQCRVCGNTELQTVLDLGEHYLSGVFLKEKSGNLAKGPLQLVTCVANGRHDRCGLLQLAHSYDLDALYGEHYGYRSGLNPSMVHHLQGKVKTILQRISLDKDDLVVDIGSNDSTTLQAYPLGRGHPVGFDPIGMKFNRFYPDHIALIPDFFSAEVFRQHYGERKAKVITSFSMFYDLEDPLAFMHHINSILDDEGVWVFEQSYMPKMIEALAYDTVCHEHLEYYGLSQILWLASKAGLKIIDVELNDVNGGSFSLTATRATSRQTPNASVQETLSRERAEGFAGLAVFDHFAEKVEAHREVLCRFFADAKQQGKRVAGLGASTKGNVILQYCGIGPDELETIGDVNEDKHGAFTPGTQIPIVPEEEVLATGYDYLLVLPWHFRTFFLCSPKFKGQTLVFPMPELEVVRL